MPKSLAIDGLKTMWQTNNTLSVLNKTQWSETQSQDPDADTEWNDILRKKGILPPKEKTQDEVDEDALEQQILLQQESVGKRWLLISYRYLCGIRFLLNWSRNSFYVILNLTNRTWFWKADPWPTSSSVSSLNTLNDTFSDLYFLWCFVTSKNLWEYDSRPAGWERGWLQWRGWGRHRDLQVSKHY